MTSQPSGAAEKWPALPSGGYISGRAAHKSDVGKGNAAFILDENGRVVGQPINIKIPQYGYFRDDKVFVIVIQAEKAPDGHRFVGTRTFDGKDMVGLLENIDLLGTRPKQ
ncbi:MAG: hypothetical protein RLZZ444_642 [Pseudomonadota bacterium]